MVILDKNILDLESGIIVHQVNCQKVMGAGLAKQIAQKYPLVKKEYLAKKEWILGDTQFVKVSNDLVICNLAGQFSYGRKQKLYTNYDALKKGFKSVLDYALENNLKVYIPYGIGCGLANGDWNKVNKIILDVFEDYDKNCFICKWKGI